MDLIAGVGVGAGIGVGVGVGVGIGTGAGAAGYEIDCSVAQREPVTEVRTLSTTHVAATAGGVTEAPRTVEYASAPAGTLVTRMSLSTSGPVSRHVDVWPDTVDPALSCA